MSDLKRVRIADPHYGTYNGHIGVVEFRDGVSVEPINPVLRMRIGAAFPIFEVEEDGSEITASPADIVLRERTTSAPVEEQRERQTEAEKEKELTQGKLPPHALLTREELEAIASKQGIAGIREIGTKWHVKHRSLIDLMELILEAQAVWREANPKYVQETAEEREARTAIVTALMQKPQED